MKKFLNSLMICLVAFLCVGVGIIFSGCDFEVNYKETANALSVALDKLNDSRFTSGKITIDGTTYVETKLPKYSATFTDSSYYSEVNQYYDAIFSFSLDYVSNSLALLSTKPTVETLTEKQEDLYSKLNKQIGEFSSAIDGFKKEIDYVNKRFDNAKDYSENKDLFVLNFKRAYRDVIYDIFELSNSVEDVLAKVYTAIDYEELALKNGTTFKSLKGGINIRIFEGYFSLIIDSYNCQVPTLSIDANDYMKEMLNLYNTAKTQFKNFYKKIKSASGLKSLTAEQIEQIQNTVAIYFEETELFQNAYDTLSYQKFYFDDDCNLDAYTKRDYTNRHYYDKIIDYVRYTLPNLTDYICNKFFVA